MRCLSRHSGPWGVAVPQGGDQALHVHQTEHSWPNIDRPIRAVASTPGVRTPSSAWALRGAHHDWVGRCGQSTQKRRTGTGSPLCKLTQPAGRLRGRRGGHHEGLVEFSPPWFWRFAWGARATLTARRRRGPCRRQSRHRRRLTCPRRPRWDSAATPRTAISMTTTGLTTPLWWSGQSRATPNG